MMATTASQPAAVVAGSGRVADGRHVAGARQGAVGDHLSQRRPSLAGLARDA